jgi:hypothetical protein
VPAGAKGGIPSVWPGLQSDNGVLQAELDGQCVLVSFPTPPRVLMLEPSLDPARGHSETGAKIASTPFPSEPLADPKSHAASTALHPSPSARASPCPRDKPSTSPSLAHPPPHGRAHSPAQTPRRTVSMSPVTRWIVRFSPSVSRPIDLFIIGMAEIDEACAR